MLKKFSLFILPLPILSLAFPAHANRSEFEQWLKQETSSFQEYKDKRDKEFTGFLKSQWKEMQTFQGLVRDTTPKPKILPKAPEKPVIKPEPVLTPDQPGKPVGITPPVSPIVKQPVKEPTPVVIKRPVITPEPQPSPPKPVVLSQPKGMKVTINFYGQQLTFYYDPKLLHNLRHPINEKGVSDIWSSMSKADFETLHKQFQAQKAPLLLNDWGYSLLVNDVAKKLHASKNNQAIFTWYFMVKAGYQARIAYDNSFVYLLLPSQQKLYAAPYFTFDNIRYYALSFDGNSQKPGRIYTYNGQYPGANKKLDMRLSSSFNTARSPKQRVLTFNYHNKTYRINVKYDKHTVQFLKTYPQMDIELYFNSNVNSATASPLLTQLQPLVEGKTEAEAVNLLLRFVQTAFEYKTDEQQFGIENYLFPEETIHYPYSDCEDRSVFFAYLVHELLALDVVGLDFPGHIATAVKFSGKVGGDSIVYNGQRFTVTDPTYINATAGMTMPQYKSTKPKVIRILN